MRTSLLLAVCLLGTLGCRGPKSSPDSTVESYFASVEAKDYDALASIITEGARAKLGSAERAAAYFAGQYKDWNEVDVDIGEWQIDIGGTTATVRFTCVGETLVSYKVVKFDCSDVYSLAKEGDGKWHIIPPPAQKLRPM